MTVTQEMSNVVLIYDIPATRQTLEAEVQPNMPWAEDHFQERVSGEPLNPPPSYEWWPFNKNKDAFQKDEKFSHTYPERFWPKRASAELQEKVKVWGEEPANIQHGVRYNYGDLDDVVNLLAKHPHTRQAWLPIWFPEDTGAVHGERVPCTLGYHFMLRGGRLHCHYVIRSVDFLRHFRDDVYMAARLTQWVLDELKSKTKEVEWNEVTPGVLTMTMFSLHVFKGDKYYMEKKFGELHGVDIRGTH
jgi:thymidylate synthase